MTDHERPAAPDDTAADDTEADDTERIVDDPPRQTPLWRLLSGWLLALEAWLRSHGGRGLRFSLRAFWGVVAAAGLLLLVGPVINPPLTLDDVLDSAEGATDTWIAREFAADYTLSRGADGGLDVEVVETITAFFPDDVDESGIRRTLLTQFQGHDLAPVLGEVTIDGALVQPAVSSTSDTLAVTLDTGERLTGDHVFTLAYRMQDLAFPSTDDASGQSLDLVDWSVFGPEWTQAFSGLDVSITLPEALDAELVRQPYGSIAWTLVSGGGWLTPEPGPEGTVTYGFTNDQNIPPNGQAWFTLPFPAGTFTMPPPTALFYWQSFGPLLPLAILVVTLLFGLAARAVAWSDARGRPWFVAQYDPPKGVSAGLAAQIVERPRVRELAVALARLAGGADAAGSTRRRGPGRRGARGSTARPTSKAASRELLVTAGLAARRAGRVGDRLRAWTGALVAPERRGQYREGLRRVPSGFVRDFFLAAPVALTLVQWGVVRQLSHQTPLAVVWWPAAFVLVSTAVALVVLAVTLAARPLTEKGALVKQHLRGIGVYAERTQLLARGTLGDPLLAYAVVQTEPRRAGEQVTALVEHELDDPGVLKRWRTRDFVSWPRILVNALALAVVAGSIVLVALAPYPYPRDSSFDRYDFATPGTNYTQVEAIDVAAELTRDAAGAGRLEVVQTVEVEFEEDAPRVPQFAQKFPAAIDGQDLGFQVASVRVDGDEVPYELQRQGDRVELGTRLATVLTGEHTITVEYALAAPVVAAPASPVAASGTASGRSGVDVVDRMRWAALLDGWDGGWAYPSNPDPLVVSFTVSDALAGEALAAGWLREDPDTAERARDWQDSVFPFGTAEAELGPPDYLDEDVLRDYPQIVETRTRVDTAAGAAETHRIEQGDSELGYASNGSYSDLGVMMEFPAGTFAGPDAEALGAGQLQRVLPILLVAGLAVVPVLITLVAAGVALARHSVRVRAGTGRDVVWRLGTAFGFAAVVTMVWASSDMPADWWEFTPLAISAVAAILAVVGGFVVVRAPKRAGSRRAG